MSKHESDEKVTTTHGGRQIFWLGHLCEGEPLVPGLPETFCIADEVRAPSRATRRGHRAPAMAGGDVR